MVRRAGREGADASQTIPPPSTSSPPIFHPIPFLVHLLHNLMRAVSVERWSASRSLRNEKEWMGWKERRRWREAEWPDLRQLHLCLRGVPRYFLRDGNCPGTRRSTTSTSLSNTTTFPRYHRMEAWWSSRWRARENKMINSSCLLTVSQLTFGV